MIEEIDLFNDVSNPLDSVEDVLMNQDWVYNRHNYEELSVNVAGRHCEYEINFTWNEECSAMLFSCDYSLSVPRSRLDQTIQTLSKINAHLWLGHFCIDENSLAPRFKHTSLHRGCTQSSGREHVEDLIEVALAECERFYNIFSLLCTDTPLCKSTVDLTLMETAGES